MKIIVVTISQLCSACHIVEGAVREMVARLSKQMPALQVEWVVFDRPSDALDYPVLEVPKFPAIFYQGEQLTAGTIPTPMELAGWMENEHD